MKVLIVLPLFLTLFFYCQEIQGFIKPSLKLLRESLQKALEERLVENKNQLEKFKKAQYILGQVTTKKGLLMLKDENYNLIFGQ